MDKKISALEKKIYTLIFDKIISELDKSEGRIETTSSNIDLAAKLDSIFREVQKSGYTNIIRAFSSDVNGILDNNGKYYEIVEKDNEKLKAVAEEVTQTMLKRVGITKDNKVVKDGYLDRLIKDETVKKAIKKKMLKSITSGDSYTDFNTKIKTMVEGTDKTNGEVKKYFNTFLFDTYTQLNRSASKSFAKKLGLQAFVYSGGKIESSRCFCDKNNGKVFTTDESKKWKDQLNEECGPIWNEDKDGVYDPLVEMGGYNCRHTPDFITDTLATRLRPDLAGVL